MNKLCLKLNNEERKVMYTNSHKPSLWLLASGGSQQLKKAVFVDNLMDIAGQVNDELLTGEIAQMIVQLESQAADIILIESDERDATIEEVQKLASEFHYEALIGELSDRVEYYGTEDNDQYFKQYQKQYRKQYSFLNSVTNIIIVINVVIFVFNYIFGYLPIQAIVSGVSLNPVLELVSVIFAGFTHGGITHILFNMYFLFEVGNIVEKMIGKAKFTMLYFGGLIFSGLCVEFLAKPGTLTLGASGAIFAVFGFFAVVLLTMGVNADDKRNVLLTLAINIAFTFGMTGISVVGHLSGLAFGIAFFYGVMALKKR